ncbi:hypothetical protein AB1Y20_004342 [Prymnesium parvum]|uniref:Uncharacterized protein n=1 Tax=Prymnesium parvum TaxID=97485 RepID=A0AB34IWA0_PRYPA
MAAPAPAPPHGALAALLHAAFDQPPLAAQPAALAGAPPSAALLAAAYAYVRDHTERGRWLAQHPLALVCALPAHSAQLQPLGCPLLAAPPPHAVPTLVLRATADGGARGWWGAARGAAAAAAAAAGVGGVACAMPCGGVGASCGAAARAVDAVRRVEGARWDAAQLDGLPDEVLARARHAALLPSVHLFDARAFRLSPAEAAAIDPQQRLLLEVAYAAAHCGGATRAALHGSAAGVFVGAWGHAGWEELQHDALSAFAATCGAPSVCAGRLSHTLDLRGACVCYDTACSAALVAAHGGLASLRAAECEHALLLAVGLLLSPRCSLSFAAARMTSPAGRCHTFDSRADGYARAEACVAAELHAAPRALCVRDVGVRHDGRSASLTAPNGESQRRLLARGVGAAGGGLEAHGTGTPLGDPVELHAACRAARGVRLCVGGGKAAAGHAEVAAGGAGLLLLARAVGGGVGAPNAQLRTLNPQLRGVRCALPVQPVRGGAEGGVSAFGYSGTIAHGVLHAAAWRESGGAGAAAALVYRRRACAWGAAAARRTSGQLACVVREVAVQLLPSAGDAAAEEGRGRTLSQAPLMEAGLDSLGAVEFRDRLAARLNDAVELPSTLAFDFPTLRQIVAHLRIKMHHPPAGGSPTTQVSLVGAPLLSLRGAGCALPGAVAAAAALGVAAAAAADLVVEVPAERWDAAAAGGAAEEAAVLRRVRHGGFIGGVQLFDQQWFRVSPVEAAVLDPQQRLTLERAYAALHAAGRRMDELAGSGTGVSLGASAADFAQLVARSEHRRCVHASTGSSLAVASGRLSYALGLHGPCVTVETACSASLVAAHLAARAVRQHECEEHVFGGCNVMLLRESSLLLATVGMTSATGRCRAFDRRADGYARGEGVCALCLGGGASPLQLRGSAVRQDGRGASLTAPNGHAQQRLLLAARDDAAVGAEALALCEAHGTGTALGDPMEAGALAATLEAAGLTLSGGKATLAHGEAAAGATGLLQLSVALRRRLAAPNAQLRALNPHVSAPRRRAALALPAHPARLHAPPSAGGGVSSFGYSGTIAHCVLSCEGAAPAAPPRALAYCRRCFSWREWRAAAAEEAWVGRAEAAPRALSLPRLRKAEYRRAADGARRELDALLRARSARVEEMAPRCRVAVVGCGLVGLAVAMEFCCVEASVAILERSASVGGVWRWQANPNSRVNNSEPGYRLRVGHRQRHPRNHSYTHELLGAVRLAIEECGLARRIHLHAEVQRVCGGAPSWCVAGSARRGHRFAFTATCCVVLCTSRRLGTPRSLALPGEAAFTGWVRRGLAGDADDVPWGGLRVLVVGMGAFAIELERTALEESAAHVRLLCRQHGLVSPQVIDYVNFIRPYDGELKHPIGGSTVVVGMWRQAYSRSGATPPESWARGVYRPDGHTVSISDLHFVAHFLDRLSSRRGEIRAVEPAGVRCTAGEFHEAQAIVKSVGFEVQEGTERLVGRARMNPNGKVDEGHLWALFEPHLDQDATALPFSSTLNAVNCLAQLIVAHWQRPPAAALGSLSRGVQTTRINRITSSEAQRALLAWTLESSMAQEIVQRHLGEVTNNFQAAWTPEEYIEHNRSEWRALQQMLAVGERPCLAYPFESVLDVLRMEAPHLLQHGAAEGRVEAHAARARHVDGTAGSPCRLAVELAAVAPSQRHAHLTALVVLEVQGHVNGVDLEATSPLFEAGMDSLGAAELTARLSELSGLSLSPLLLAQNSTPEAIAEHILEQLAIERRAPPRHVTPARIGEGCLVGVRTARSPLPPVFAVGDPEGQALPLAEYVCAALPHDVYALEHPYLHSGALCDLADTALGELADKYARLVVATCASRGHPSHSLIGVSLATTVVHFVAVGVVRLGGSPERLILVDPAPLPTPRLSTELRPALDEVAEALLRFEHARQSQSLSWDPSMMCVGSHEDEVAVRFAECVAVTQRTTLSAQLLRTALRRLRIFHHQLDLIRRADTSERVPACSTLLVFSARRDDFYQRLLGDRLTHSAEALVEFYGGAAADAIGSRVSECVYVDGDHFDVTARCVEGRRPEFTTALQSFLDEPPNEHAAGHGS